MNSHPQREQLTDLLSDALGPTERARVESHLAQCEQCARELRALQLMQQSLATLPAAAPPDRVRANVRAALRENKKQIWTLPAFVAARKQTKIAGQESAARSGAVQPHQRIGAPKALPFALPARQLAWGGAVALSAIGLMLLARPSLQNDSLSKSAPVGEAELASRAASDQSADQANDSFAGSAAPNASGATANSATGATNGSATTNSANVPATNATKQAKPNAPRAPKSAPGSALPMPESVAPLPPLPPLPPPPRARTITPETFAPAPPDDAPSFDFSPALPPPNPRSSRPSAPAAIAPKTKPESKPKTKPPVQSLPPFKLAPAAPPKIQSPPAKVTPLAPPSADAKAGADISNQNDFAPVPLNEAPRDNERARRSSNAPNAPASSAPPTTNRASDAPLLAQKSAANPSSNWTGGAVTATLRRGDSGAGRSDGAVNTPLVLTLGVSKAIGNARLFLLLPSGETRVWRGSMNAVPLEIRLPELPDNLRSGQKIRARLEQTDNAGNPTGSTLFTLLWP